MNMRSKFVDEFNHDDAAEGYDIDTQDEKNPIRDGYKATLEWVIAVAQIREGSRVLELGSGTGILTAMIPRCQELICVDVSQKMEDIALEKVGSREERIFIRDDILGVFERELGQFDVILSTYTIHHLTETEKRCFFNEVWNSLRGKGKAVFGDLMLETRISRDLKITEYKEKEEEETAEAIAEEFFWHVDESREALENMGFIIEVNRFSDLSFGILAQKP